MDRAGLEVALRAAAEAQGVVVGVAKKQKRGKASLTVIWLRPEPVILRADMARGKLVLDGFLPFVMPGGRLHRQVKAFVIGRRADALLVSRGGNLSLGLPAGGDWVVALAALLALAQATAEMLQAEWPDYARGVFAKALI